MKLEYLDPNKKDWFLVSWDLSGKCNYRCSYCPSFLHDGQAGWPDWNVVKRFVHTLNQQLPNKKICFRFSGGEPTYWKHFLDLADLIKSNGNYFSLLSNGSRDVGYFSALSKMVDGLILSYHPEYSSADHFIEISRVVECPVAVNLMLLPETFDSIVEVAQQLYNNSKMAIWPKVILDKTGAVITNRVADYSESQQAMINSWPYFRKLDDSKIHRGELLLDGTVVTANDLIMKGLNKHQGWQCWSGIDQINVSIHGEVFRADCQVGGSIGTLENFVLPTAPQICDKEVCACLSDIYLRKEQLV
jgi:hypothetical protein